MGSGGSGSDVHEEMGWSKKKVLHKDEEKMHKKVKMTLQSTKNLVHVKHHYGVSFCKKIFSYFDLYS